METAEIKKPWYKKWWGIVFIIFTFWILLPILGIYLIWKKTEWHKAAKIAATIAVLVIWIKVLPEGSPQSATTVTSDMKQEQVASNHSGEKKQPNAKPAVEQPKPPFDVPALFDKNISQIRTALGGKPKDAFVPTEQSLKLSNYEWEESYRKDGAELMVTFNYKTGIVEDFFITSSQPEASTNKNILIAAANIKTDASDYRVKFVEELKNPGRFTGVIVTPPKTVQARIKQREKYDVTHGNNLIAATKAAEMTKKFNQAGLKNFINIELEAPENVTKDYAAGGDENDYYKGVTRVTLNAIIDNLTWSYSRDSEKTDLVTVLVKEMIQTYSKASPYVNVSNGIRPVATGKWSEWSGIKVELK